MFLWTLTGLPTSAGPARHSRFVPDEIIVKLRAPAQEQGIADARARSPRGTPHSLKMLRERYRVRQIRPLLADFARQQALRAGRETFPAQENGRSLQRHRRMQAAREATNLGCIYRLVIDTAAGESVQEVLEACRRDPDVEYAERNPIIRACGEPNDPLYASQWALEKIQAAQAWDTAVGSEEIVVAVIDTGVDYSHRDLQGNLWLNEAERHGVDSVDDDENGYIDDVYGYNFAYNDSDPFDDNGHGTHCAGIIAAIGDNGLDTAGICWHARIMSLKVLGADGDGTAADAVPAIYYAVANGADVISSSWGGEDESESLKEAVAYAHRAGVLVVAAAGNEDSDSPFYPAAHPEVIAVAATDSHDERVFSSNYGSWVDIAAPGRDILSLRATTPEDAVRGRSTTRMSGTSMAAPHVAGACALLLSTNPLLTRDEVEQIVTSTGDPIATGICASNRRLNVAEAMRATVPPHGTVRFDRAAYSQGAAIGVLLADWHLRGAGTVPAVVETDGGDAEHVILTETTTARGVFRAALASERAEPQLDDGRVQAEHAERIVVRYLDMDDGAVQIAQWTQAYAHVDYEFPVLVARTVETRGPTVRFELTTSESTRAEVRCGEAPGGPYTLKAESLKLSGEHEIPLRGLRRGVEYYYVIVLVDEAGNETIADNDGLDYSFVAGGSSEGFRVPAVYATIQEAIDDAWHGDTIWVADGTYSGQGNIEIDFQGKVITVRSENGPQACIIDCQQRGRAFYFHNGEDERAVLDGFTITHGGDTDYGGGVRCMASSPTIRNCIFTNNSADQYGGGLCNCYGSSPTVIDCVFRDNTCSPPRVFGRGGAIANRRGSHPIVRDCLFVNNFSTYTAGGLGNFDGSSPHVIRCVFRGNSAGYSGGAIGNWSNSQLFLKDCVFTDNTAESDGGAVCNQTESGVRAENCIFSGNRAAGLGGAMKNYAASALLMNCTISGNRAGTVCGGLWSGVGSRVRLDGCIVWANTDGTAGPDEPMQVTGNADGLEIDYCCVQGWTGAHGGVGNFGLNPLFVDPPNGDFHLQSQGYRWDAAQEQWTSDAVTSPCIDAGDPSRSLGDEPLAVPDDPNNVLTANCRINMGAYGGTAAASIAPCDWALPADLDNDGYVYWPDLAWLATGWPENADRPYGDLTRNGSVDIVDFAVFARQWRDRTVRPASE